MDLFYPTDLTLDIRVGLGHCGGVLARVEGVCAYGEIYGGAASGYSVRGSLPPWVGSSVLLSEYSEAKEITNASSQMQNINHSSYDVTPVFAGVSRWLDHQASTKIDVLFCRGETHRLRRAQNYSVRQCNILHACSVLISSST